MYLSIILDWAIKELITINSVNNSCALKMVTTIFNYAPLTHQRCLESSFKVMSNGKNKMVDYSDYVFDLKKSNEAAYFYNEFCNSLEPKLLDIFGRVLGMLEIREAPTKKSAPDDFFNQLQDFAESLCTNTTNELFDMALDQFTSFLTKQPYPNCIKEIKIILGPFIRRTPEKLSKILIPLAIQAIISKDEDAKVWKLPLGSYFKETMPEVFQKASHYSINKYLSEEHLAFFCGILAEFLK